MKDLPDLTMRAMPKIWISLTLAWVYSTTLGLVTLAETVSDREELAMALGAVSGARMLADITQLSGAGYHGRQTGTPDDLRSGLYVAERFRSLGLRPLGTTSLGPHGMPWATTQRITTPQIGGIVQFELSTGRSSIAASLGPDYLPIFDSPAINATATVVFVGYGIADPSRGFDEYEGLDVRNRIVLFLRGKPRAYPVFHTLRDKQRIAREKGAVAFLTATGPIVSRYEAQRGFSGAPMAAYSEVPGERPLPGAWISTELAESIMASRQRSLRGVQEELNRSVASRSVATGVVAHLRWNSTRTLGTMVNVLGITPDNVKTRAQERQTIVVGAHRDHFGRMGTLLFPGADDNASGTAIVLEVARTLAQSDLHLKRNILFVSFSGEEQGLLGSKLYVRRPAQPLNSTAVMVNVDHAGVGNGKLIVGVTGLPKTVAAEAARIAGMEDKLNVFGFFPGGDHVPFKEAGVPTFTIVSAGPHPDFHQASDTAEKVRPEILELIARYVVALAWHLAQAPR